MHCRPSVAIGDRKGARMIQMLSALFMITAFSDQKIVLPWEFNRITLFNNQLYFASYTGSNIFFYHDDRLKTLTSTHDPLFVIDAFYFTPFFLYLTDGRKIVKYYLQPALSETIYYGNSITGFC